MKTNKIIAIVLAFWAISVCEKSWNPACRGQSGPSALLAAPMADTESAQGTVKVIVRFARIRTRAAADGKIIKQVGFGTMLRMLGKNGEYFQVTALGAASAAVHEAWYVHQSEVEVSAPAPTSAAQLPPAGPENRQVTFEPRQPVAAQPVLFTALNFRTPNLLKWDMGDGTVLTSGSKPAQGNEARMAYAFLAAGTYLVKVYDDNGNMRLPPLTVSVTVAAYARSLKVSPENPQANSPLAISAMNFKTPENILWDFGDGSEIKPGDAQGFIKPCFLVSHTYAEPGAYVVKAYDEKGDKSLPPVTLEIRVGADARQIRIEPENAVAGIRLQFNALNFNTPNHLRWDMGDGTILPAENGPDVLVGSLVYYSYKVPGSYRVKVYDWNADPSKEPVQALLNVSAAAAVAGPLPEPVANTGVEKSASEPVVTRTTKPKKDLLIKIGPYAGFFQPQDAWLKKIYGNGDVIYGARLGVHVWQGLYFWLSAAQFKVIGKTTFTEDKTTLTLTPLSAFLRYRARLGFFNPYIGAGMTFMNFKEESDISPGIRENGSDISFEGGFELKMNRHFFLDFGVRYEQIKVMPTNVEVDLGGLQAGVTFFISF